MNGVAWYVLGLFTCPVVLLALLLVGVWRAGKAQRAKAEAEAVRQAWSTAAVPVAAVDERARGGLVRLGNVQVHSRCADEMRSNGITTCPECGPKLLGPLWRGEGKA